MTLMDRDFMPFDEFAALFGTAVLLAFLGGMLLVGMAVMVVRYGAPVWAAVCLAPVDALTFCAAVHFFRKIIHRDRP